ncbi:MAG: hypothetical protein Q7J32_04005 [Sphingomonadaceae bacterium]|nr:hypothetical protein [Sphingomonadaceae bacterium]
MLTDQRHLWRATFIFGLLTLALFAYSTVQGVPDCGAPLPSAMLDFELALDRSQFAVVLDCAPRLAALDQANFIDLLLFMWAYGGLLTFFALAAGVRPWLALTLGALMVGPDFVETMTLRWIAAGWPLFDPTLVMPLAIAVRVKFVAIGAAMVLAGLQLWRGAPGMAARSTALLAVIGGVGSVAIIYPEGRMAGAALTGVAWLAITLHAGVRTLVAARSASA